MLKTKKKLLFIGAATFFLALAACQKNNDQSSKEESKSASSTSIHSSQPSSSSESKEETPSSSVETPFSSKEEATSEVISSIKESISSEVISTVSSEEIGEPSSEIISSSEEEITSSEEPEVVYDIKRPDFTPDYDNYSISGAPSGVNMTYYSDIYSRGFAWITDTTAEDTELYLVESDEGENADFDEADQYLGEATEVTLQTSGKVVFTDGSYPTATGSSNSSEQKCLSHKVHIENLEPGKAYSYKIGSELGYAYGAFIVEKENNQTITAVHMSDAQTKDPTKLNVWRNTFTNAVKTAGKDLDMALYNGDQFDQNMEKIDNVKQIRFNTYSTALDVISDYKFDIPYMTSSGNHEPASPYVQYLHSDINYPEAGVDYSGCFYSYDYNFAHFVVLNTNDVSTAQIRWLKEDLENASDATWKIVMLHIAPYSTGDHTNKDANQNIVEKLTPIFSEEHVDLVLQAHDHTYNKTLPYKWDAAGYTTTYNNEEVVNFSPETEEIDGVTYDKNPEGTYYVTTGAAGHRAGAPEASDGIWAEVVKDGNEWKGVDSSKTFLNNKYKIEMGTLKYANQYEPYTTGSYTVDQDYEVGDLATGCVNAQMFGVLNLSEETLSYNVYTVNDETVKLFDSVDVLKA